MATQAVQLNEEVKAQRVTVGFQLHVRMPGVRAKIAKDRVDLGDADAEMVHLSKDILDSDEFRAIQRQARLMRAFVRAKSTPSPVLKGGVYLLPIQLVEEVQKRIEEMKIDFDNLVECFIAAYDAADPDYNLIEQAKLKLGNLFDGDDYPAPAVLKKGFGVETAYISMETPSRLRSVSRALFEQEQKKAAERWRNLEEEVSGLMRAEMKSLVDSMVNALTPKDDGKKRAFKGVTVENLSEFLRTAPFRNVSDDAELDKLVKSAAALLDGLDPEVVRKNDGYRAGLRNSFEILQTRVEKLVGEKPTRAISFEEDV